MVTYCCLLGIYHIRKDEQQKHRRQDLNSMSFRLFHIFITRIYTHRACTHTTKLGTKIQNNFDMTKLFCTFCQLVYKFIVIFSVSPCNVYFPAGKSEIEYLVLGAATGMFFTSVPASFLIVIVCVLLTSTYG